jgi:formylglycine-generating enzyme required for sulfatase activity
MRVTSAGCVARSIRILLPGGLLRAGAGDWEAQGRITPHDAVIAPFELDSLEITEDEYAGCARDGACSTLPLRGEPGSPITGLTRAEAARFCSFRGGRLPTEDEWTWAAGGALSRRYPWGDTGAVCRRGAWGLASGPCGFGAEGPELAGSHPDGATPEGILDLSGNVAEWVAEGVAEGGGSGRVRGGSWGDSLATGLRTWQAQLVPPDRRSAEIGARCAHDLQPVTVGAGAKDPHPMLPLATP